MSPYYSNNSLCLCPMLRLAEGRNRTQATWRVKLSQTQYKRPTFPYRYSLHILLSLLKLTQGFKLCCLTVTITINEPLFKKQRDIIFFWWENHFMSHFEGHFEGAKNITSHLLTWKERIRPIRKVSSILFDFVAHESVRFPVPGTL
jgi:hypothetical protein